MSLFHRLLVGGLMTLGLIIGGGMTVSAVWQEPVGAPPGNNVLAPLNQATKFGSSTAAFPLVGTFQAPNSINFSLTTCPSGQTYLSNGTTWACGTAGGNQNLLQVLNNGADASAFTGNIAIGSGLGATEFEVTTNSGSAIRGVGQSSNGSSFGLLGVPNMAVLAYTSDPNGWSGYFTGGRGIVVASTLTSLPNDIIGYFQNTADNANVFIDAAANKEPNLVLVEGGSNLWSIGTDFTTNRLRIRGANFGSEVLSILSDGRVGIGTQGPTAQLEVKSVGGIRAGYFDGEVYVNNRISFPGNAAVTGANAILTDNGNRDMSIYAQEDVNIIVDEQPPAGVGDFGVYLDSPATPPLFIVKNSGNVGVGTANPGAKLEVTGQIKITGGVPGLGKVLTSDATGLATWQTPTGGGALPVGTNNQTLRNNNGTWEATSGLTVTASGIVTTADNFNVGTIATNPKPIVVSGNGAVYGNLGVGPGALSPSTRLDIDGQIRIRGGAPGVGKVLTSDATGLASWITPTVSAGPWTKSGTNIYPTTLTDNIGIGTITPSRKLDITAPTTAEIALSSAPAAGSGSWDGIVIQQNGVEKWYSGVKGDNANADYVIRRNGSVNDLTVQSATGNIGIGTSAPSSQFTVQKNVAYGRGGEISIVNGATATIGNTAALNFGLETSSYNLDAGNAQIKALLTAIDGSTDLIFSGWNGPAGSGGSFSEYMRIQAGGEVGIGNTNPTAKLDINNSSGNVPGIRINNTTSNGILIDATGQNSAMINLVATGVSSASDRPVSQVMFRTPDAGGFWNVGTWANTNRKFYIHDYSALPLSGPNGSGQTRLIIDANGSVGFGHSDLNTIGGNNPTILTATPKNNNVRFEIIDNLSTNATIAQPVVVRITDLGQNPELQFKYGAGANDHWGVYADNSNDSLNIWGGGNNRLTILQDGKVGIGVTSPSAYLSVNRSLEVIGDSSGDATTRIAIQQGSSRWQLMVPDPIIGGLGGSLLLTNNGNANGISIAPNSNVGIGTFTNNDEIDFKLTVAGSGKFHGNVDIVSSNVDGFKGGLLVSGEAGSEPRVALGNDDNPLTGKVWIVDNNVSDLFRIFPQQGIGTRNNQWHRSVVMKYITPVGRTAADSEGYLGLANADPQSKFQVGIPTDPVRDYTQIDGTSGVPPLTDCDSDTERGRMIIDSSVNNRLYVCNGAARGWDYIPLTN